MKPSAALRPLLVLALLCASAGARADGEAVADMSLEELLNVDILTASRKSQRLNETPAAAFVVTGDEIVRSGATTLPEMLRLVPGVEVAQMASNRWAVTVRGFNSRFSNKLLVLMDGRSIYSPLFSGVFWEAEDVLPEDIERIEVIRGPGAAMWGANAVNGVINIITKRARATQGLEIGLGAGSEVHALGSVRYGGAVGDDAHYRVWAKAQDLDPLIGVDGRQGDDDSRGRWAGLRFDRLLGPGNMLTVIGNAHHVSSGDRFASPTLVAPFSEQLAIDQINRGANLLARYAWRPAGGGEASLQGSVDHSELDAGRLVDEQRDTFDIEYQRSCACARAHELLWGLGYRVSRDRINTQALLLGFDPARRTLQHWSAFIHDEITLVPHTWRVMVGARLEHYSLSGFAAQPSVRTLWTPHPRHTLWAAYSRAARTPSRAENDDRIALRVLDLAGPGGTPRIVEARRTSADNLEAEIVETGELGYRAHLGAHWWLDLTAFGSHYHHLRTVRTGAPFFDTDSIARVVIPFARANLTRGRNYGTESVVDWHPARELRLMAFYATLRTRIDSIGDPAFDDFVARSIDQSPRYSAGARLQLNLGERQRVDLQVRRVGELRFGPGVSAYTAIDASYGIKPRRDLELTVSARNLFDPSHSEFISDFLPSRPVEAQRALFVKVTMQF